MDNQKSYIADLVAFVKPADLPPSLRPFIRSSDQETENIRYIIFKIRGTVDSYYGLAIDKNMDYSMIEQRLKKDLTMVRLADDTQEKLPILLKQFQAGQFAHYLKHQTDQTKFPHRH